MNFLPASFWDNFEFCLEERNTQAMESIAKFLKRNSQDDKNKFLGNLKFDC